MQELKLVHVSKRGPRFSNRMFWFYYRLFSQRWAPRWPQIFCSEGKLSIRCTPTRPLMLFPRLTCCGACCRVVPFSLLLPPPTNSWPIISVIYYTVPAIWLPCLPILNTWQFVPIPYQLLNRIRYKPEQIIQCMKPVRTNFIASVKSSLQQLLDSD